MLSGFPPVSLQNAKILVLGSMPGIASLQQQQYYAHPRNLFWPFMAELLGFDEDLDYPNKLIALQQNRIALWDVMQQCEREGSLDSAIVQKSIKPNDFVSFLHTHPQIECLFFNGKKAQQVFLQHVYTDIKDRLPRESLIGLPSTSPANAGMSRLDKLRAWRQLLKLI